MVSALGSAPSKGAAKAVSGLSPVPPLHRMERGPGGEVVRAPWPHPSSPSPSDGEGARGRGCSREHGLSYGLLSKGVHPHARRAIRSLI